MVNSRSGRKQGSMWAWALLSAVFVSASMLAGCTGSTDGGEAAQDAVSGTQFVSDGGAGGSLTIRVVGDLRVADTVGFSVTALDPRGAPLAFVRIFCESENGIAILEPSSGGVAFESTNAEGFMSGRLGGLLPGSYIMECRGPEGFNLVDRVSIVIRGTVPADFEGFPGAAGGNLGGGLVVQPDRDINITAITFSGVGDLGTNGVIDLTQNPDCDGDPATNDPEPFTFNDYNLSISNGLFESIFLDSVTFSVREAGRTITATQDYSGFLLAPSAVTSLTSTFLEFDTDGTTVGGNGSKKYAGTSSGVLSGTYPVTFTVRGTTESGDSFTRSTTVTLTFGFVNNC